MSLIKINIGLEEKLKRVAKDLARRRRMSLSRLVNVALRSYLQSEGGKFGRFEPLTGLVSLSDPGTGRRRGSLPSQVLCDYDF